MSTDVESGAQGLLDGQASPKFDFGFASFLKREHNFEFDAEVRAAEALAHEQRSTHTNLICKHWLRGLCKKGESCEFIHEYNLRSMPECSQYARHGTCTNGSDCLYLHLDPALKQPPCAHYERGFCPLGPDCAARHVKRTRFCRYYLAGFCPNGKACPEGAHPVWKEKEELEKPHVKKVLTAEEQEQERERLAATLEKEEENRGFADRSQQQPNKQGRGRGRKQWGRQRRERY